MPWLPDEYDIPLSNKPVSPQKFLQLEDLKSPKLLLQKSAPVPKPIRKYPPKAKMHYHVQNEYGQTDIYTKPRQENANLDKFKAKLEDKYKRISNYNEMTAAPPELPPRNNEG